MGNKKEKEKKKRAGADGWEDYLREIGEADGDGRIEYVPDMDGEEMLERHEMMRFFQSCEVPPETEDRINRLLKRLPCREENVVSWIFTRGMSVAEVAEELGVSRNAVRITKSRALKKLKAMIGAEIPGRDKKPTKTEL